MAKPTGTPPSPYPGIADYALPPLPPSPDDAGGPGSLDTPPSTSSSAQRSAIQGDSPYKVPGKQKTVAPHMSQATAASKSPPSLSSTRPRAASMVSSLIKQWGADAGLGSAPVSGVGKSSSGVVPSGPGAKGGASLASRKPSTETPAPPPPSDVPPPPLRAQTPKVPPLALGTLGTASGPVSNAAAAVGSATRHLNTGQGDGGRPTSTATSALKSPVVSPRTDAGAALSGDDVKLELRYFIDAVLENRVDAEQDNYPDQLGELLVYMESKGGTVAIGSDVLNRILRGNLRIRDYTTTSGTEHEEVNVITKFSQPFMNHLLGRGESLHVMKQLLHEFDKVAAKVDALSENAKDASTSDLLKNKAFIQLMAPVEKIFMDYVCGPEHTLASSRLPEPLKKLLLTMDKHLIRWFNERGTGLPKDLLKLRQNAQVGYLATRSVTAVWRNRCDELLGLDDAKKYAKMFAYLNACASKNLRELVMDIISSQTEQPREAQQYVRAIQSPRKLLNKEAARPNQARRVLQRGKTLEASVQPMSSRTDDTARKLKKEQVQHTLARANFAEQIIADAGLKDIDPRFRQHLKDRIVDLSRRGFENFKADPIPYCLKYASGFYANGKNVEKAAKGAAERVRTALARLSDSYQVTAESDMQSESDSDFAGTTITTTAATRTTTTTATTVTTTKVAPMSGAVARKRDDDSSIEVSTPSSSDGDASSS
ncbi:MAG: hypothetical protein RL404_2144 [Pseudomonadota bacterium]